MNILFTSAGRRNYLIKYFKQALAGSGQVYAADMSETAPALADADVPLKVPNIYSTNYVDKLAAIVRDNDIKAIICLNDLELPVLCEARPTLELLGARLLVPSRRVIDITLDKWKTFGYLHKLDILVPETFIDFEEAIAALKAGTVSFPMVVKPRWGSASIHVDICESLEELELAYALQSLHLKKSILGTISQTDPGRAIIIQEGLVGSEFGMDIVNDLDQKYVATYARKKLAMRAGETDKAVSIVDARFDRIGRAIGEALGHIGNMDCDLFEVDGRLYVLELNPRFGGGYPFSHEAGANVAAMYVGWLRGERDISEYDNYRAGLRFAKYEQIAIMR